MTKITPSTQQALKNAVDVVKARVRSNFASPFTATEFLRGVLPPEDYKVLNIANAIVNRGRKVVDGSLPLQMGDGLVVRVYVCCTTGLDVLLPNSVYSISPEAPQYEPITEWVRWHQDIVSKFTQVKSLIDHVAYSEWSLEQLRYVMPGVVMLCKNDEYLAKYVDRLQDYKPPKITPTLGPRVRAMAAIATEILSMAALASAKDPDASDFIALQL